MVSHLPVGVPTLRSELTDDERARVSRRFHQGHAIVAAFVLGLGAFLVPLAAAGTRSNAAAADDDVVVHPAFSSLSSPSAGARWQYCSPSRDGRERVFFRAAPVDCDDSQIVDCVASCAASSFDASWRVCSSGCAAGDVRPGFFFQDTWLQARAPSPARGRWGARSLRFIPGSPFDPAVDNLGVLTGSRVGALYLDAVLAGDATVGDVNAALIDANASLAGSRPGDTHLRIDIGTASTVDAADAVEVADAVDAVDAAVAKLRASPAFAAVSSSVLTAAAATGAR